MKFKKSSLLTKIVVLVPVVAATVTLVSLQAQLEEKQAAVQALSAQVSAQQQENQRLQNTIDEAGTDEGVKDIARDKLGMAENGEIIFYDIGQ